MVVKPGGVEKYVGAISAGFIVLGILASTMGLQFPVLALEWLTINGETWDLGDNKKKWEHRFFKQPDQSRQIGGFLILLRAVANGSTLVYSAFILPERNPEENLNLSKYLLAWLEAPLAGLGALVCLYYLLKIFCKEEMDAGDCVMFAKFVRRLARFSALSSLPYANPAVLWGQLQGGIDDFHLRLQKQRDIGDEEFKENGNRVPSKDLYWIEILGLGYVVFSQMAYIALFACAAIGSVVVKTSQVNFVSAKAWHEWTPAELIQLASFINALSGLGLDPNLIGLVKVLRERYPGEAKKFGKSKDDELVDCWQVAVTDTFINVERAQNGHNKLRRSAIVVALSLDLTDCCNVMNEGEEGDEEAAWHGARSKSVTVKSRNTE